MPIALFPAGCYAVPAPIPRSGSSTIRLKASPEFALVCASIARPHSDERTARIVALAAAGMDWGCVERIAARHRVAGLVREGLTRAGLPVPRGIANRAHHTTLSALKNAGEALRLQNLLEETGIEPLFLKGSALAIRAYGSIAVRDSIDIDMVVAPADVARAWTVLNQAGYSMTAPSRPLPPGALRTYQTISKDSVHVHSERRVRVELHWRLSDAAGEAGMPPVSDHRMVEVPGSGALRTLADPALFTYLCVHGSGHAWARLKWLADIAALLGTSEDGGAGLWAAAQAGGAARPAASAIMLANAAFGTPFPPGFVPPRSLRLALLNRLALRVMAAGGGARELADTPWNSVVEPSATLLTLSRWRDAWSHVRRVAIPAEDVVLLRLPAGLSGLYPLLRLPLWIWKRSPWSPRKRTA
ncbi:nucleotidyltransferase family protein [Sphingomonas sp. QA11]|uniref:nucleotidyltransferase domain-containing protein n=1 Tax=Sphingomonas sp. QA11 TaxID=2950605 RepID=UPI00234A07E9|nr:nucleotidyltransferase family protein [Sphingomonas sp. QA11]WCM29423.1 nucleotidyltransferase family protein [Sphingomonas sp. QA11]